MGTVKKLISMKQKKETHKTRLLNIQMGIKKLNQYFLNKCSNKAIKKISFRELIDKTIVVDISIYIYKFLGEDVLMSQMYVFLSLFKYYHMTPVFIFDGKPPPEKMEILKKRKWEKRDARDKYELITSELPRDVNGNIIADASTITELSALKKKMVKMTQQDLIHIKELMDAFGFVYYTADGEADELCAYFVNTKTADICMSDDMDMFLLGCSKVLRNVSLMNHSGILYDSDIILKDLDLDHKELIQIMTLHGTDYSQIKECRDKPNTSLTDAICLYRKYKEDPHLTADFYTWLNIDAVVKYNTSEMIHNCSMFDIMIPDKKSALDIFIERFRLEIAKRMNIQKIKDLMHPYGFIFI